jgi:hypothetical protein
MIFLADEHDFIKIELGRRGISGYNDHENWLKFHQQITLK